VASLVWPSLTAAAAALMMFKVLDYSLFRAAKELVYVPLSFDARYRAKELIDAFGYRLAKGGASLGLVVANRLMTVPAVALPGIALVALVAWIPLAAQLTASRKGD
jgi:AAA family ATP:ADP antiporter